MRLDEYDKSAVKLADEAYNKVLQFHYNREFTTPKPIPPEGFLYHYTNTDGLKGIIEKNELWATSAYFLNDSAEVLYGCQVLKDALDAWIATHPRPEDSLTLATARQLLTVFGEHFLNMHVVQPIYLSCFCEEDNLLSQWRAYGQSGGYSLGFQVPADIFTGLGFKPEPCTYTPNLVRVEYERDKQIKRCSEILDNILPAFDSSETARAFAIIDDHPQCGYSVVLRSMVDVLMEEIVGFKSAAFAVEKEWRVVVRQRLLTKQGTDDGGRTPTPVHFPSSSRGALIPYVKLIPNSPTDKLPIRCVRTGPTLDVNVGTLSLPLFFEKHGFSIRIRRSEISLRP